MPSPIAIFAHARVDHLRRTIDSLLKNPGAANSDAVIFSDGARSGSQQVAVDAVREYLATISGFRSVKIHHRHVNYGLAKSIIEGVTEVLTEYDSVIILEDDIVTSPYFLTYMNDALDRYSDDERVISIHGYVYPVQDALPEAFFLRGADCWGWATWRRGWRIFNPDGKYLLDQLKRSDQINVFDFNGTYGYSKMLYDQIRGENDSWAVRWYASAFLAGKLTLYPGRSLVHNIGNDSTGTHCGDDTIFDVELSAVPIDLSNIMVKPSDEGRSAFEGFFKQAKVAFLSKVRRRIKRTIANIIS